MNPSRGFTLIEILVVLGMLALLSTVVLVAVNPLRQFAQARNTQREANVSALLNAVGHRLADNRGVFQGQSGTCTQEIPDDPVEIASGEFDLRPCLVPDYLPEIPFDPTEGTNTCVSVDCNGMDEGYSSRYEISQNASTSRITICAPLHAEPALDAETFCLTR